MRPSRLTERLAVIVTVLLFWHATISSQLPLEASARITGLLLACKAESLFSKFLTRTTTRRFEMFTMDTRYNKKSIVDTGVSITATLCTVPIACLLVGFATWLVQYFN